MFRDNPIGSMRTIILFALIVPVIIYLLHFAYIKNKESESRANECQASCIEQGHDGHSFKWDIFSGPQCECLDQN